MSSAAASPVVFADLPFRYSLHQSTLITILLQIHPSHMTRKSCLLNDSTMHGLEAAAINLPSTSSKLRHATTLPDLVLKRAYGRRSPCSCKSTIDHGLLPPPRRLNESYQALQVNTSIRTWPVWHHRRNLDREFISP